MTRNDVKSLIAGLIGGALIFVVWLHFDAKINPPVQPSVPGLVPSPLSCLCGTAKQIARPFKVACPYCRSLFTVQPSAAGDVAGDLAVEK